MSDKKPADLILFNFKGDELSLVKHEGNLWVVVKRVCEHLGIDDEAQRKRLLRQEWPVTSMVEATGSDGKTYKMFAIALDSLPMWLATIDSERVSEHLQPKLVMYQKEAHDTLRDKFLRDYATHQPYETLHRGDEPNPTAFAVRSAERHAARMLRDGYITPNQAREFMHRTFIVLMNLDITQLPDMPPTAPTLPLLPQPTVVNMTPVVAKSVLLDGREAPAPKMEQVIYDMRGYEYNATDAALRVGKDLIQDLYELEAPTKRKRGKLTDKGAGDKFAEYLRRMGLHPTKSEELKYYPTSENVEASAPYCRVAMKSGSELHKNGLKTSGHAHVGYSDAAVVKVRAYVLARIDELRAKKTAS